MNPPPPLPHPYLPNNSRHFQVRNSRTKAFYAEVVVVVVQSDSGDLVGRGHFEVEFGVGEVQVV